MEDVARPRSLSRITVGTNDSDADYMDAFDHVVYSDSLELLDTIREAQTTVNLFMNNEFELAEERMAELADKSMYHSMGYTFMVFVKAVMTVDKKDLEKASDACKTALVVIEKFRQRRTLGESLFGCSVKGRHLTDEEIHAELVYAQVLLVKAVLAFFSDDNFASFIKGALSIRTCYHTYRYCERLMNEPSIWVGRSEKVRAHFESGTRMGIGIFSLMISCLPSKVLKLLEVVGFTGDKELGMSDICMASSMTGTLYSPMCKMTLLTWHLFACYVLGTGKADLRHCEQLMPSLVQMWPNGAIQLFLRARLLLVSSDIDAAIKYFNASIASQSVYRQFHHGCYWELLFAHAYKREWTQCANYAQKLQKESKWSPSVYTYLLCIFFAADESVNEEKRNETIYALASKVDGLRFRIAGKSIPIEKYCGRRAKRFLATKSLFFAHYEFVYFWNGFDIIGKNNRLMQPILEDMDRVWQSRKEKADLNDNCLYHFLRGVVLRHMGFLDMADKELHYVLEYEKDLTDFTYIPPNATYELAIIQILRGNRPEAESLLSKARSYKSYSLENKLHFRIHSAMDTMGCRTPMN